MQRNIKVLVVEPDKIPYEKVIPNNLQSKQKEVGGNIEYVYLMDHDDVCLICNEEGKLEGLPVNQDIGYDFIVGTFLIVGDNPEIGEDRSLTNGQIERYKAIFNEESIIRTKIKYAKYKMFSNNYEL